jgi:hypothetical protein
MKTKIHSSKQKKITLIVENNVESEVDLIGFKEITYDYCKYDFTLHYLICELSKLNISNQYIELISKNNADKHVPITINLFGNTYFVLLAMYLALNNTKQVDSILDYQLSENKQVKMFISSIESIVIPSLMSSELQPERTTINYIIVWVEQSNSNIQKLITESRKRTPKDPRINTTEDCVTIKEHFSVLLRCNKKGVNYLTEPELDSILFRTFLGFKEPNEYNECQIPSSRVGKEALGRFVYKTYIEFDKNEEKTLGSYAQFLINEFEIFTTDTLEYIKRKLSGYNPKKYPFNKD